MPKLKKPNATFWGIFKHCVNVSFEFSRQNCFFQLSSYAEEWAQKLAREDTFEHRTNQELGENLYCSWSSNPKAKCPGDKPVDSWYSEIKKYNFGAEPTNLSSGESSSIDWLVIFDKTNSQTCLSRPFYPSCVEELEKVGHWQGQKQEW